MERYLILGGTGTLGQEIVKYLYEWDENTTIYVVSRDELKQQHMKAKYPNVNYLICDVRDKESLDRIFYKASPTVVFHVAALKHVDVIEDNITEAVKTNLDGLVNSADLANDHLVDYFVFSSTDKAVLPINAYGFTKALGEKFIHSFNDYGKTVYSVFRWGNILGSRGSVIHTFAKSFKEKGYVNITSVDMTRFWLPINYAVTYMMEMYERPLPGEAMIPHCKSFPVIKIAEMVAEYLKVPFKYKVTGLRPGEKIHECLKSTHDECLRSDTGPFWEYHEIKEKVHEALKDGGY